MSSASVSASELSAESPLKASSNAETELTLSSASSSDCVVLIVGSGIAGLACCLALSELGCDVHVYEDKDQQFLSSSEAGVPWTEELAAFCAHHQVAIVCHLCWGGSDRGVAVPGKEPNACV